MTDPTTLVTDESGALDADSLIALYKGMLLLRQFELAAQASYRKGDVPGFIHLYVGEEAVAVGVCSVLRADDWVTSTHRGHGHVLAKGASPREVMAELFGRATGTCGGRGGSMHLYDPGVGLFGTNGFVGGGIPAAVGIAMGAKTRTTDSIAVTFFGDGASNHASFHESVNFAAVQNAPVVFVCENNLYATATPFSMATRNPDIASRSRGYGIPASLVDGNDVLAVREAAREAVERARRGLGPSLIEARTYRTVGHHEGDQIAGTYRTQEEVDSWKERCPIARFRAHLSVDHGVNEQALDDAEASVAMQVKDAVDFAAHSPHPAPKTALDHGWASFVAPTPKEQDRTGATRTQAWLDAVRDGIAEEMRRDPSRLYFGEGIGERGGSFGHTKGLWQEFGPQRVIDTPICELGFTGAAIGASATGSRTIADLMFADFVFEAASQLIEQAAKLHGMSNGRLTAPVLVRAGSGAIKNAGPHHSGSYHSVWAHCPGLIVVMPSTPMDAKGLIKSALRASDPIIFLEPKSLFAMKGEVPVDEYTVQLGQARIVRTGSHVSIVSAGALVHRCVDAATRLESQGISCEVIDLRTIAPLDVETVAESVVKTGKLLVVDEDYSFCGIGAELGAAMMELVFDYLDAPVGRLHTEPVAQPFSPPLEEQVVVTTEKIERAIRALLKGAVPLPRRARAYRSIAKPRSLALVREVAANIPSPASTDQGQRAVPQSPVPKDVPTPGLILMPNIGLTETEATVIAWRKDIGSRVAAGDVVLEIQSEKAMIEVEAPCSGTLDAIYVVPGTVAKIGQALGLIREDI